jgi:uncharacterized protein (DUF1330 family)
MPAYLIVGETLTDIETFEAYKKAVVPVIVKYGGKFLARGGDMEVLETDGWSPGRMVLIEFPNMAALKEWYDSAEYAPIRDLRFQSASSTLIAVEGAPPV